MTTRRRTLLLLGLILIMAALLRLPSYKWDQGYHLHLDEQHVTRVTVVRVQIPLPPGTPFAALLDPQRSPLDPRVAGKGYAYGALPPYLTRLTVAALFTITGDGWYLLDDSIQWTGRILAGLADLLTLLLVFLIGRALWGAGPGLLAAALYAFAPLAIQNAHFFTVDAYLTAGMTVTLLWSILYYQTRRAHWLILAGVGAGLALGCKITAAPLVLPLVAVLAGGWRGAALRRAILPALATGAAILITLFIADPFALLDPLVYWRQLEYQAGVQWGTVDVAYTRRWVGYPPVLHPWWQLVLLGAGPLVGVAGTLGIPVVAARWWRDRRGAGVLLLVGAAAYFALVAFLAARWVRYYLPLVPYLCLFASAFGFWLLDFGFWQRVPRWVRALPVGVLLAGAVVSGLAFQAIYGVPSTRVSASNWIYANIPAGSRLGLETADDFLPQAMPGHPTPDQEYRPVLFDMLLDRGSPAAAAALLDYVNGVDYLILGTQRASRTVPRLPWRYPVQNRFYELLEGGQLGFTPVYHVAVYPAIFGLPIPDDREPFDLSFNEYDHPPITIYRKARQLSGAEWAALFAAALQQPSYATRQAP